MFHFVILPADRLLRLVNPSEPTQSHNDPAEGLNQHSPYDTHFPNIGSYKNRIRTKFQRIKGKHRSTGKSNRDDSWTNNVDVAYVAGASEMVRRGVVLFDSQSGHDLISTNFAETFGENYSGATRSIHAYTVTGDPVMTVGKMKVRWHVEVKQSRWPFRSNTKPLFKYYSAELLVIESDMFDVIIGRLTINKHSFFERKDLLAAFREKISIRKYKAMMFARYILTLSASAKDVKEQEKLAKARREQSDKERKQHEQQQDGRPSN